MFTELIKNYERIRDYMRDFYVYGFKSREKFNEKSLRSYDDERRRIESYLKDHIKFTRTQDGKNVFIEIDTRHISKNPLYKSLKSKSFTDKDITLHFIIFDILYAPTVEFSVTEIMNIIYDEYLSSFDDPISFDESTVRKKLKEYEKQGLIESTKKGKINYYKRTESIDYSKLETPLAFFSEISPIGALGSFILDKLDERSFNFAFKHHYIMNALDSDILLKLFEAIREKREIILNDAINKEKGKKTKRIVPLQIFASVQGGRTHVLAYDLTSNQLTSFRVDYIKSIKICEECVHFDAFRAYLEKRKKYMWGVVVRNKTEHIDFTVEIKSDEQYIVNRLCREKRVGCVDKIDDFHYKFSAEVCDSWELIPWIRTFICRITSIHFSNEKYQNRFFNDFEKLYLMYN